MNIRIRIYLQAVLVAQLVRALILWAEGRVFESRREHFEFFTFFFFYHP